MGVEFETQDVLERISCVSCGVLFAVPKDFLNTRRQDPNKISIALMGTLWFIRQLKPMKS